MSADNVNSESPIDKLWAELSLRDDTQKSEIDELKGQLAYMTVKCDSKDRQLLQTASKEKTTYDSNLKYSKLNLGIMNEYKDENRKLRAEIRGLKDDVKKLSGLTDENKQLKVRIWRMQFAAVVHFAVWGCITIYNIVYNMIVM